MTAQLKVGTIAESLFPGIVLKLKVERLEAERNVTRSVVEAVTDWKDTVITWDLTSVPKAPSFCSANTTTARSAVSMSGSTSRGPGMSCPH